MEGTISVVAVMIMLVLFNFYFVNVVTSQESKPELPPYPFAQITMCNLNDKGCNSIGSDLEHEEKMRKYEEVKGIRDQYNYNRNVGLLVIGIVNILIFLVLDHSIGSSFGLAGILTVLYGTMLNWSRYNDKTKLGITTAGLASVFFIFSRGSKVKLF